MTEKQRPTLIRHSARGVAESQNLSGVPTRVVLAIPGATVVASTNPGLAFLGKAFRLSKALLLIGCADQPSPN